MHPPTDARDRERDRRGAGLRRLYDTAAWRRTKRAIKARDPMCTIRVLCGGRARTTDIDHKVRAEIYVACNGGDESYFFDENNLRGAWREPDDLTHKPSIQK